MTLFAVLDKTHSVDAPAETTGHAQSGAQPRLAGVIGFLNASPAHLSVEIGWVLILPAYQRTHVTSNAIGLLLHYCLEPPPAGLGLRRVQWQANARNRASVRAAERMGFVLEGVLRWQRVLGERKEGNAAPVGRKEAGSQMPGRDSAMLAICWDDWEEKKEAILKTMQRQQ